jgi:hypothetical protein
MLGLASLRLDDPDAARRAIAMVPEESFLRANPEAFLARHGATEAIKAEMTSALREVFAVSVANSGVP